MGRDDPAALLDLAELAERLGYDSVWVGDSPIARPRLDPLTLLAAVAARTERASLGTAVLLGALRPPVPTAHALASLDLIAGGRLIVGLGAGFPLPATQAEFRAVGVPFEERVGRLMETVEIWRMLWREPDSAPAPTTDFAGRYWRFRGVELAPKPRQRGGPPLWLAGSSRGALQRAGARFDGWLPYPPTPTQYAEQWEAVKSAASAVDRREDEVTPGVYVTVALDDDKSRAQARLDHYCRSYYGLPLEAMRQVQGFYAGDAGGCVDWLDGYVRAGARHIVLRQATLDNHREQARRAAEEVLPRLRVPSAAGKPTA
jgi:alkanesulfonate monooxygenase SsuD/methylene tetrahydromethanopterin reductase-like flavin-dependent oxidoreductase (luciferase family)